jgi:adenylate kinase family enzyme
LGRVGGVYLDSPQLIQYSNMYMIYLIGGAPRAGKSQLSKRLAHKLNISRINLDDITTVFEAVVPDYGLSMDMDQYIRQQKSLPVVESLINLYLWRDEDVVIEGVNFDILYWPKYKELAKDNIKMIILGYSNITAEDKIIINTRTTQGISCWFEPLDISSKLTVAQEMINRSIKMKQEVEQINDDNLRYYETHTDLDQTFDNVINNIAKYV